MTAKRQSLNKQNLGEYRVWKNAIQRCSNPKNNQYANYGERGISMCELWRNSFAEFFAHVGKRPSPRHQLDRKDNDRGYEPGNVHWATNTQNARNRRGLFLITIDGVTKCAAEWDEFCGFGAGSKIVVGRYKRGWRGQELLAPLRTIFKGRKQSAAEKRKRSLTMKRNRAKGLYSNAAAKTARTKRRQFANGTAYNVRNERGCFVGKQS